MNPIIQEPEVMRRVHPLSVEAYHALGQMGIIDPKVELLNGYIVEKMSKSPLHTYLVERLLSLLTAQLPEGLKVRIEQPLTFSASELEPDLAVVVEKDDNYLSGHPTTAHLVVEVAASTLKTDREKAVIYASAGVSDYWLIDAEGEQIECYSDLKGGVFQTKTVIDGESGFTLKVGSIPEIKVVASDIFPG